MYLDPYMKSLIRRNFTLVATLVPDTIPTIWSQGSARK